MNLEKLAEQLVSITGTLGNITAQLTGIVGALAGQPTVTQEDTGASKRQTAGRGEKRAPKAEKPSGKAPKAEKGETGAAGGLTAVISTGADNGRTRLPNGIFADGPDIFLTGPNGARLAVAATKDGRAKIGAKFAAQLGLKPGQAVTFTRTGKGAFAVGVTGATGAAGPKASKGKKAEKAPKADVIDSLDLDAIDSLDLDGAEETAAAPEKAEKPACVTCKTVAVKTAGAQCSRCKRVAAEVSETLKKGENTSSAQSAENAVKRQLERDGLAPKAEKGETGEGKGKGSRPKVLKGASKAKREAVKQAAALSGKSLTEVAEAMSESMKEATLRHPTPETSRVGK